MVWDNICAGSLRYLFHHYVGQYLEEKIASNQMTVQMLQGKFSMKHVRLSAQSLNEKLANDQNWPLEFLEAFIDNFDVTVPYLSIRSQPIQVIVTGLHFVLQPRERHAAATSMLESVWHSMSGSMDLAEDYRRSEESSAAKPIQSVEKFAAAIQSVFDRIQIKFVNTSIVIEHVPHNCSRGVGLEFNIDLMTYGTTNAESASDGSSSSTSSKANQSNTDGLHFSRSIQIQGISVSTLNFTYMANPRSNVTPNKTDNATGTMKPDQSQQQGLPSAAYSREVNINNNDGANQTKDDKNSSSSGRHSSCSLGGANDDENECHVVLCAKFAQPVNITLRLKQFDDLDGPKVQVEIALGSLQIFMTPRQMSILSELLNGLCNPETDENHAIWGTAECKPMTAEHYALIEKELPHHLNELLEHCGRTEPRLGVRDGSGGVPFEALQEMEDETFLDAELYKPIYGSEMGRMSSASSCSLMGASGCSSTFASKSSHQRSSYMRSRSSRRTATGTRCSSVASLEISKFHIHLTSLSMVLLHNDVITQDENDRIVNVEEMQLIATEYFDKLSRSSTHLYAASHLQLLAQQIQIRGDEKCLSPKEFCVSGDMNIEHVSLVENSLKNEQFVTVPLIEFESRLNKDANMYIDPHIRLTFKHTQWDEADVLKQHKILRPDYNAHPSKLELAVRLGTACTFDVDLSLIDRLSVLLVGHNVCHRHEEPTQLPQGGGLRGAQQPSPYKMCANTTPTSGTNQSDQTVFSIELMVVQCVLNVRFPQLDLRPIYDTDRLPWWMRNNMEDFMSIELSDNVHLRNTIKATGCDNIEVMVECGSIDVHYHEVVPKKGVTPLHIARAEGKDPTKQRCKISINFNLSNAREQEAFAAEWKLKRGEMHEPGMNSDSKFWDDMMNTMHAKSEPSLFCKKRVIYQSGSSHFQEDNECASEEVLAPGSKQELEEFKLWSIKGAAAHFDIVLPWAVAYLPSKHYYELLYNRINNVLLMWEPTAPAFFKKSKVQQDEEHVKQKASDVKNASNAADPDNSGFTLCHSDTTRISQRPDDDPLCASVASSVSDSMETASGVSESMFYSAYGPQSQHAPDNAHASSSSDKDTQNNATESKPRSPISMNLTIKSGWLHLLTPVREPARNLVRPELNGEFHLAIDYASLFVVSGKRNDPSMSFICLQMRDAHMYHCHQVKASHDLYTSIPTHFKYPASHMLSTIYRVEPGARLLPPKFYERDLITVAIQVEKNPMQFRRPQNGNSSTKILTSKTKKVTVSVIFEAVTLRHRVHREPDGWMSQIMDFFVVGDYPILGYTPKENIVELYIHFFNSAIDYRPRYLPIRCYISLGALRISSHLSTDTSSMGTLRFIAEDCALFLRKFSDEMWSGYRPSPRPSPKASPRSSPRMTPKSRAGLSSNHNGINLMLDYVCVFDLDTLDISLRTSSILKLSPDHPSFLVPHIDFRASNNTVNIRTCADSAYALTQLIKYYAMDDDLNSAKEQEMLNKMSGAASSNPDESPKPCDRTFSSPRHMPRKSSASKDCPAPGNGDTSDDDDPDAQRTCTDAFHKAIHKHELISVDERQVSRERQQQIIIAKKVEKDIRSLVEDAMNDNFEESHSIDPRDYRRSNEHSTCDGATALFETEQNTENAPSTQKPPSVTSEHPTDSSEPKLKPKSYDRTFADIMSDFDKMTSDDKSPNESDDDFYIVGQEPGCILPKRGECTINWLTDKPVKLLANYFTVPLERCDPLKTPSSFPPPLMRYMLCEMSVVWHLYGGHDFPQTSTTRSGDAAGLKKPKSNQPTDSSKRPDTPRSTSHYPCTSSSSSTKPLSAKQKQRAHAQSKWPSWVFKGGPQRDHDTLLEVHVNRIRFKSEIYSQKASIASRYVLVLTEVEVLDRLAKSDINKLLCEYTSEARPKQTYSNMFTLRITNVRGADEFRLPECCLRISMLPLRFNIDQDTLDFTMAFFKELCGSISEDASSTPPVAEDFPPPVLFLGARHKINIETDERIKLEQAKKAIDENLLILLDDHNSPEDTENDNTNSSLYEDNLEKLSAEREKTLPIYFRKVVFTPDVPVRLDYCGKYVSMMNGPLHGLIMGLGQLNYSELCLKSFCHRQGILGVENLVLYILKTWLKDIKERQLAGLLSGIGPMYSIVQFLQGIRDLFWLPIEQYKKDGRIMRGLHRGANSFTASTAMAVLELTTRLIQLIQVTAEIAFDMLTPGPSITFNPRTKTRRKRSSQPRDIREGFTRAVQLVKEGWEQTTGNLMDVAVHEHEHKGYAGAVSGVIRQVPSTIIRPILFASEATTNVLDGVKCQLVPDTLKDTHEKWRHDEEPDIP